MTQPTTREPGDLPNTVVFRTVGWTARNGCDPDLATLAPACRGGPAAVVGSFGIGPSKEDTEVKTILHSACAAALLSASPALAAQALVPAELDGVVVTANRAPQRIDKVGGQITLIGPETIRRSQATAVSDLLAQTPGVTFSRNGGLGAATSVRIRGAEEAHTVVLIDGVKLNDPSSTAGGFNFGNLLIGDVDRVEILRGAQSVLWGSQALGGVVNIITADPAAPFEAQLDAEVGTHHSGYLRGALGGKTDRVDWRVTAAQYVSDGISAFNLSRGGYERDGYRNSGASGKAVVNLTDQLSLDLRAVYSKGRTDFDGFPAPLFAFADTHEYGTTEELVAYAGLNLDLFGGRFRNRLGYAHTDTDRDNFNPQQAVTTKTFDAAGRNARWEYQGTVQITDAWSGVFGAENERSTFRTASPSAFTPNPVPARNSVELMGVYGQLVGSLAPGLTVAAGVRRDDHDTFGDSTVGQASVAWALNEGATVLRASWGQGFKAPSLFQLYSDFGNTRLAPEEAESWDAGIEQRLFDDRLVLQAAYFSRDTTNQIDFVSCTASTALRGCIAPSGARRSGFYENIGTTEGRGVELQAQVQPTADLRVSANYTRTDTENVTAGSANRGKDLPRRPADAANLEVSYRWPVDLTTTVAVRHAGDSFDDAANRTLNKGYTVVDLRASYPVNPRLEVYGRVENIGDERYETVRNYGQVRRTAAIGLRSRF